MAHYWRKNQELATETRGWIFWIQRFTQLKFEFWILNLGSITEQSLIGASQRLPDSPQCGNQDGDLAGLDFLDHTRG